MLQHPSRRLKICSLHRSSRSGEVPYLRIAGTWLAQLGFQIGDRVTILVKNKQLIIEPAKTHHP